MACSSDTSPGSCYLAPLGPTAPPQSFLPCMASIYSCILPMKLSLALCLSYLKCYWLLLASAIKCGGRVANVASSIFEKISYLSLGSVTVAMNDAKSIYSGSLWAYAGCYYSTPKFLCLSYSFWMSSFLNSSGIFWRNSASSPSSLASWVKSV
jgi:hypothetical protein